MTEDEQRKLRDEIAARGFPVRCETYEGDRVVTVPGEGKPGRLILKSRFEAWSQGYVVDER